MSKTVHQYDYGLKILHQDVLKLWSNQQTIEHYKFVYTFFFIISSTALLPPCYPILDQFTLFFAYLPQLNQTITIYSHILSPTGPKLQPNR